MSRKTSYHHGNLRAALLEAAFSLLMESGVEGLSLRGVAKRAGVSPSAPYHHFKDKQAILTELALDRRQRVGRAIMEAIALEATPGGKLKAFSKAYLGYALEYPEEFRLMFSGSLQLHIPENDPRDTPIFRLFRTLLAELDPRQSEADLEVAVITIWSLIHGLAQLLIDGPLQRLDRSPDYIADLAEGVLEGLALFRDAPRALKP